MHNFICQRKEGPNQILVQFNITRTLSKCCFLKCKWVNRLSSLLWIGFGPLGLFQGFFLQFIFGNIVVKLARIQFFLVLLRFGTFVDHFVVSQMDSVISQAQSTLGALVLQRSTFGGINSKISNVSSRLPTVCNKNVAQKLN